MYLRTGGSRIRAGGHLACRWKAHHFYVFRNVRRVEILAVGVSVQYLVPLEKFSLELFGRWIWEIFKCVNWNYFVIKKGFTSWMSNSPQSYSRLLSGTSLTRIAFFSSTSLSRSGGLTLSSDVGNEPSDTALAAFLRSRQRRSWMVAVTVTATRQHAPSTWDDFRWTYRAIFARWYTRGIPF